MNLEGLSPKQIKPNAGSRAATDSAAFHLFNLRNWIQIRRKSEKPHEIRLVNQLYFAVSSCSPSLATQLSLPLTHHPIRLTHSLARYRHRYNLKRKVLSLPPLTAFQFNDKILEIQKQEIEKIDQGNWEGNCLICKKVAI